MGRAIRATSMDREAASLMGINQYRIYNVAFGIGAATTGHRRRNPPPVLQCLSDGRRAL